MEFSNRNLQSHDRLTASAASQPAAAGQGAPGGKRPARKRLPNLTESKWMQILFATLLISATVLFIALIGTLATARGENRFINKEGYQVVSLADKQFYFGKITAINDSFISMVDVFYFSQGEGASGTNLLKRGGEVHCPTNRMTFSRNQVSFWENIQSDSQVGKLIDEWQSKNPNGPVCAPAVNTPTSDSTEATTQPASTDSQDSSATDATSSED